MLNTTVLVTRETSNFFITTLIKFAFHIHFFMRTISFIKITTLELAKKENEKKLTAENFTNKKWNDNDDISLIGFHCYDTCIITRQYFEKHIESEGPFRSAMRCQCLYLKRYQPAAICVHFIFLIKEITLIPHFHWDYYCFWSSSIS